MNVCMSYKNVAIQDVSYKFQLYICKGCHGISMIGYELKNIALLNAKGVDYIVVFYGVLVKMMQLIG